MHEHSLGGFATGGVKCWGCRTSICGVKMLVLLFTFFYILIWDVEIQTQADLQIFGHWDSKPATQWNCADVIDWLATIGLTKYDTHTLFEYLEWILNDIYIYIMIITRFHGMEFTGTFHIFSIQLGLLMGSGQAGRWSEALQLLQAARDGVRNHRPMLTRNGGKPILCWYFLNGTWITYIYIWLYNNVYIYIHNILWI